MFRPLLTAARAAARSAPRAAAPSQRSGLQALRRPLTSSSRHRVEYRRFDNRSPGQPDSGNVMNYVRRRVGGDRGMVIYGLLIGGGAIYYVAQCVVVGREGCKGGRRLQQP